MASERKAPAAAAPASASATAPSASSRDVEPAILREAARAVLVARPLACGASAGTNTAEKHARAAASSSSVGSITSLVADQLESLGEAPAAPEPAAASLGLAAGRTATSQACGQYCSGTAASRSASVHALSAAAARPPPLPHTCTATRTRARGCAATSTARSSTPRMRRSSAFSTRPEGGGGGGGGAIRARRASSAGRPSAGQREAAKTLLRPEDALAAMQLTAVLTCLPSHGADCDLDHHFGRVLEPGGARRHRAKHSGDNRGLACARHIHQTRQLVGSTVGAEAAQAPSSEAEFACWAYRKPAWPSRRRVTAATSPRSWA